MKAQGFDYVPVDPEARQAALVGQPGLSREDFEKQFGYGITTLYEQRRKQSAAGPNEAVRAALSDAERSAYDRALFGEGASLTFVEALDTGNFSGLDGCVRKATDAIFGGPEVIQTVQTRMDELDERIFADPRVAKAVRAWSGCMRSAGYPDLTHPDDVDAVLEKKLEEIVGSNTGAGGTGEPGYDRAALAALQQEEVAMVRSDLACEEQHLVETEDEVTAEYEREFREQNADLLGKVPSK
jgi:hypothetical protein